ncbi:MAG: hypothetical protein ACTSUX_00260 [Promethearchaeota archaeon]
MAYIERKYKKKIFEIFKDLDVMENELSGLFKKKSVNESNKIANLCAKFNRQVNLILGKYYPEIKDMENKLNIKSYLKFYFDLIDKLTNFIRNVSEFKKMDDKYYESIIDFLNHKENLIKGKYRRICKEELSSFYDKKSRENLERIISEKFERRNQEFFGYGSLEEEIKKIAKIAGAKSIRMERVSKSESNKFKDFQSIIHIDIDPSNDDKILKNVLSEIKTFLESKKFKVFIKGNQILTDVRLLPSN